MREFEVQREKHPSIELSDEMIKAKFVYRQPCKVDKNSPEFIKQKQALAEHLCKETKIIDLTGKNEKSKSETPKRKLKKISPKSNKAAVETVQKEL